MASKSRMLASPEIPRSRTAAAARRLLALILATTVGVLATPGVAFADIVTNTVTAAGENRITVGGTTTIGYLISNTNSNNSTDPQNSCNPADSTPATLTVSVPTGVTVTPASRTFTGCGSAQTFVFASSVIGDYPISVSISDAGTGTYSTTPASFRLFVSAPVVVNTPPSVAVTGVTSGVGYEFGAVPIAGCAVTDAQDGNSSFAASLSPISGPRAAQGLGSQTASCSYTDSANGGGLTATASATYSVVDTTAPTVEAIEPAPTEATGPTTPVEFSASAHDAVDGSLPVVCVTASAAAFASGGSFPVGTTTLTCSATDRAGNTGTAAPIDVVVTDTTEPEIWASENLVVGNDLASVTYDAATATDIVDGELDATCSPASGSSFPLGITTVTCTAADAAGNIGSAEFTVTVQDVTKPVVTVPGAITLEATGPGGAVGTYAGVSAEDDVDGLLIATCDAPSGATFPLGTTTITCSAADAAGNTGTNSFTVTVQDTTVPAVVVPEDFTVEAESAAGAVVSFSATASDIVSGALTAVCTPASGSSFGLGATLVTCTATDAAGLTGSESFTITVSDTTPPAVTVPGNLTAEATGPDGATVTHGDVSALDTVDGAIIPICSTSTGAVFPLGTTTVTCSATDAAGNLGSESFTVTVVDTTEPEVTAPANLVVGNTSGTGADNVTYSGATAVDLVDGSIPVSCTPASGSTFPLGFTTVTCTATDEAGNTGSATFTIEVQDQTEPVVTVPSDITAEATGPTGATVSWIGVSALDDVDGPVDASCSRTPGSVFPLGATPVTCEATDRAGNTGSSYFTITVEDTTAPSLTVTGNVTATATSPSGATVTYSAPTAVDLVDGTVPASCDVPSGSLFPLGSTTVTCSATDAAGNTGDKQFTVTVTLSWSNVLQPINVDGSSAFKQGSTVPVKFTLTGASAGIGTVVARLYVQRIGAGAGSELEALSTSAASTGNEFRYDASSGQYIFNLGTKKLTPGQYQLRIDLGDGVLRTVIISLR